MTNSTIGKSLISEQFAKIVHNWTLEECLDYLRKANHALNNCKIPHMVPVYTNAIEYVEQHCKSRFDFIRGQTDQ